MPLYPSLAHQLSVTLQRDAESAAASARRAGVALHPPQLEPDRRRRPSAHGRYADAAAA